MLEILWVLIKKNLPEILPFLSLLFSVMSHCSFSLKKISVHKNSLLECKVYNRESVWHNDTHVDTEPEFLSDFKIKRIEHPQPEVYLFKKICLISGKFCPLSGYSQFLGHITILLNTRWLFSALSRFSEIILKRQGLFLYGHLIMMGIVAAY